MNLSGTARTITNSLEAVNPLINAVVITILILLMGFILGKLLGRLVHFALRELKLNRQIRKAIGINIKIDRIIGAIVSLIVYSGAVILALEELKLTGYFYYLILILVIVVFFMSVLGTLKDLLPNLVAGLIQRRSFKVSDIVILPDAEGQIIQKGIFELKIMTKSKDVLILPYSVFMKSKYRIKRR